ncbi:MAG: MBL fold metallo-hydrolase [Nitrospira sp.]|nr:MBL fold metallo-hydrolase [Nitrospira sp.]
MSFRPAILRPPLSEKAHPLRLVTFRLILTVVVAGSILTGCVDRIVEPTDVFGDVHQGETYSPASRMIDDWYAVEAIDAQTFAINEPKSSQYNTSYLLVGENRALMFDAGSGERPAGSRSMREVAARYAGNKPIMLILSHFHYDHIADTAAFDGVILIDRPDIRASIKDGVYTIGPMKNPALPGGVSSRFKLRLTRLLPALVLDIVPNRGLADAHCGGENPRAQTPPPSQYTLRTMCGNFSFSCRLVTLFKVSTTLETAYFGGITMCKWTWSRSTPISSRNQSG